LISGATSAVYSKSATSDEDIGSYDVIVANDSGNVTSASAAVAVASPSVETAGQSATNGQGQSGGGGGAPSDWFFGALLLMGLVRAFRRNKA
jgi:MYXO-CTERM domain-containing protein